MRQHQPAMTEANSAETHFPSISCTRALGPGAHCGPRPSPWRGNRQGQQEPPRCSATEWQLHPAGGALLAAVPTMATRHFRQRWCQLRAAYLWPRVAAAAPARAPFSGVFWGSAPALSSLTPVLWPSGSCYGLPPVLAMDPFNATIGMNQSLYL